MLSDVAVRMFALLERSGSTPAAKLAGRRVPQQPGAVHISAVRKAELAKRDDRRKESAHAARSRFGKQGASGRDPKAPTAGNFRRSAAAGRKMFRPAAERRTKLSAMFRATTR